MICTLSKHEAEKEGYNDSLMVDHQDFVAEATGANIFFIKENSKEIHTPVPDCFLDGITRRTIIDIAKENNFKINERKIKLEELKDFVNRYQFNRLGVFTYSHEENTHDYNFEDDVPSKLKKERADSIMDLQSGISFELNAKKIGKEYKVLIDRAEDGYFIGRSEYDSPEVDNEVLIEKNEHTYCRIGDFVKVKITKSDHYDLYGELVG